MGTAVHTRYRNSGAASPTFSWAGYVASAAVSSGARCAQLADMDLDGDLDVVVASENDNHIAW